MKAQDAPSVANKKYLERIAEVLDSERAFLKLPPLAEAPDGPEDMENEPMALCLSGGGIRSATFSLGVLQGLARMKLLGRFHFLSTVSGGGYIGTWLSAWIRRAGLKAVLDQLSKKTLPAGEQGKAASFEPQPIRRLRAYSNFLSPVVGLSGDSLALIAIYIRNLIVHWSIVLPMIAAILLLPRLLYASLEATRSWGESGAVLFWLVAAVFFSIAMTLSTLDLPLSPRLRAERTKLADGYEIAGMMLVSCVALSAVAVVFAYQADGQESAGWLPYGGGLIGLSGTVFGVVLQALRAKRQLGQEQTTQFLRNATATIASNTAMGFIAGLLIWIGHRSIAPFAQDARFAVTFGFPVFVAAFWFSISIRAGLARRRTAEEGREWWGRASGLLLGIALLWMLLSMLVIQAPTWILEREALWIDTGTTSVVGIGGVLLAIGAAAKGFWSKNGAELKKKANKISTVIGAGVLELVAMGSIFLLLFVANLALSYVISATGLTSRDAVANEERVLGDGYALQLIERAKEKKEPRAAHATRVTTCAQSKGDEVAKSGFEFDAKSEAEICALQATPIPLALKFLAHHLSVFKSLSLARLLIAILALLLLGLSASWGFGANTFSLNALYGNRLTRAYLGASKPRRMPDPFVGFDPDDNIKLADIAPRSGDNASDADPNADDADPRLLHVFNAALNLVRPSGGRLEWQQRKAASFFMTPFWAGSDRLGFVNAKHYGGPDGGMSAGRAMAISGAAASPSMGYHTSPFVAALMSLFNVRLGWWMPNPRKDNRSQWKLDEPRVGIGPVLSEMFMRAGDESSFVLLSDGGHFENLGLYEMVRRRCKRILVVDAAYDPKYRYEDIENAVRKIRIDFGVEIKFDKQPPSNAQESAANPAGPQILHHFVGRIVYDKVFPGMEDGTIVCVKPILSGNESIDLLKYAESTRAGPNVFPQQSTGDQFFDEAQFESYRELGWHSVLEAFGGEEDPRWPVSQSAPGGADQHSNMVHALPKPKTPQDESDTSRAIPGWAPESTGGAAGGLIASLGTLGQSALIASALTLTAVVSITGTVALSNPEVRLSEGSTVELADHSKVSLEVDKLEVAEIPPVKIDVPGSLDTFFADGAGLPGQSSPEQAVRIEKLKRLVLYLKLIEPSTDGGVPVDVKLLLDQLKLAVDQLVLASGHLNTATNNIDSRTEALLTGLKVQVDALKALTDDGSQLGIRLEEMLDILISIEIAAKNLSPRNAVRGDGR